MEIAVQRVKDFEVTGNGKAPAWATCPWHDLTRVGDGKSTYATRVKTVYSDTGIYFLVACEDRKLTCRLTEDNAHLYTEDVVEVFLQPDSTQRTYFEYEISPTGYELPLMVSNDGRGFMGWLPWQYTGQRVVRRATAVEGGSKSSMASCTGWQAEFVVPYALLRGLGNVPPKPGTKWQANVYRLDYDVEPVSHWAWCPDTGAHFHNYRNFGALLFQ